MFAVGAIEDVSVSFFDFVTASYVPFLTKLADSSGLDNTEPFDKIFDTNVFVIFVLFDISRTMKISDCLLGSFTMSKLFVSENKDLSSGKQFFCELDLK